MKTFIKASALLHATCVEGDETDRRYFARPLKPVDTTGMKTDLVDVLEEEKFTQFLKKSAPFGCDLRKREYRVASTEGKARIHCAVCPPSYVFAVYFAVGTWNPTAECLSKAIAADRIHSDLADADKSGDRTDLEAGNPPNAGASGPISRMLEESSDTLASLRKMAKAGGSKLRKLSATSTISDDMRFLPSWSFTTAGECIVHDNMFFDGEKCRPCDLNRRQYRKYDAGVDDGPNGVCSKCGLGKGFFFYWRINTFTFVCDSDTGHEAAGAVFQTGFFYDRGARFSLPGPKSPARVPQIEALGYSPAEAATISSSLEGNAAIDDKVDAIDDDINGGGRRRQRRKV